MLVSIFLATTADIQSIVSLVNAAYRGGEGWTNESHLLDGPRTNAVEVARLLEEGVILMYKPDGLAGCVYLQPQADALCMGMLSVVPALQGAGIGDRLELVVLALSW